MILDVTSSSALLGNPALHSVPNVQERILCGVFFFLDIHQFHLWDYHVQKYHPRWMSLLDLSYLHEVAPYLIVFIISNVTVHRKNQHCFALLNSRDR